MLGSPYCYFKYTDGEFMQNDSRNEKDTKYKENGLNVNLWQLNFLTYVTKHLQIFLPDYRLFYTPHLLFSHLNKIVFVYGS